MNLPPFLLQEFSWALGVPNVIVRGTLALAPVELILAVSNLAYNATTNELSLLATTLGTNAQLQDLLAASPSFSLQKVDMFVDGAWPGCGTVGSDSGPVGGVQGLATTQGAQAILSMPYTSPSPFPPLSPPSHRLQARFRPSAWTPSTTAASSLQRRS